MSIREKVEFGCHISVANAETAEYDSAGHLCYLSDGKIAFFPDNGVQESTLRKLFGHNPPTSGAAKLLPPHLPGLSDFIPLPNTFMHNRFSQIIGPEFSGKSSKNAFRAYVRYLNSFEKNGLQIKLTHDKKANALRDDNLHRHMAQAEMDLFKRDNGQAELIDALMRMHPIMVTNEDVTSEKYRKIGQDKSYQRFILTKSQGNQNMVFDLPHDYTKKVKINVAQNKLTSQLEALANRVTLGAGFSAPKTDLMQHANGTHYLVMDNYKVTNDCPIDRRQQYLLDLMGKPVSEVNANTYDEMAKFMETYELNLPPDLRSLSRMEKNKERIFQWALINSSMNNTDNHGRNIAVLFDEKGRIEVAPFIDINFDPSPQSMSTTYGGPPPMERIDISNDTALKELWEGCGLKSDFSEGLALRDRVVSSLAKIPQYANELGIPLHSEALEIVAKSTSVHSPETGKVVGRAIEAGRLQVERENNRTRQASAGMEF